MSDVVVTVPKRYWDEWLDEGHLAGEIPSEYDEYAFYLFGPRPQIEAGERVYIVAHGRVRGYAPLTWIMPNGPNGFALMREGGAVACTIPETVQGFRGWRYRWWEQSNEVPFPDWKTAGIPQLALF